MKKILLNLLTIIISIAISVLTACGGSGSNTEKQIYTVTYQSNGSTNGNVPIDSAGYQQGQTVVVSGNTGSIVKSEYCFKGWNTAADGNGTTYTAGETFLMGSSDITLFAKWISFTDATTVGDLFYVSAGTASFNIIYANNSSSITFPKGLTDNDTAVTLTRKFFMGETEVTNAIMAAVLQWAKNNGKIVETGGAHNEVNSTSVKYGTQVLVNLGGSACKISYSGGNFTVVSGYENHPAVHVTWYGAVIFCNWLTEMKDGNTNNLVYTGIDTTWDYTETVEDASKTGYRMPSNYEWEYAARYIGTLAPTVENLSSECVYYNKGGLFLTLTSGYYWTPGDYASGAIKDYTNQTENRAVAWYSSGTGGDELKAVAGKTANQLGLYDISGNASEWCFINIGALHYYFGGDWQTAAVYLEVGSTRSDLPNVDSSSIGFRLTKTQ